MSESRAIEEAGLFSHAPVVTVRSSSASEKRRDSASEKASEGEKYRDAKHDEADEDDVTYRNGEPIISTGRDVSRFVVDIRDDGDAALTVRSLFLGTLWAGLGAALYQVRRVPKC